MFNHYLKEYITDKSESSLNSNECDDARIIFNGIPYSIAKEFINFILESGGLKIYNRNIPLYLLDPKQDNWKEAPNPEGGICGKDYILNLRNSKKTKEIIVIVPEGCPLDKSNTTSFISHGIDKSIEDEEWVNHDMIETLIKQQLAKVKIEYTDNIKSTVNKVISSFHSGKTNTVGNDSRWELIKSLGLNLEKNPINELMASLGLINSSKPDFDKEFEASQKLYQKIADYIDQNGINNSINNWKEKYEDNSKNSALDEFKNHYHNTDINTTALRDYPFSYFSRISWNTTEATWWEELDTKFWKDILDDSEKLDGACKIEITNSLYSSNKPCPVVRNHIDFKIINDKYFDIGTTIEVYKKRQKYELIDSFEVDEYKKDVVWTEDNPAEHNTPLFYKFKVKGLKDSNQKVISLKQYKPGVTFEIPFQVKATAFKEKTYKGSKNKAYISQVLLRNTGIHELTFDYDNERLEYEDASIKTSGNDKKVNLKIRGENDKGSITFEVEDSSDLILNFKNTDGSKTKINISITLSDEEPIGVSSIFEKLITQNRSPKGINEKVAIYPLWNRLHQLQKWIMDSDNYCYSFYPLILGPDYANKDCFQKPDWKNAPYLSNYDLNNDCRPPLDKFLASIPDKLVEKRKEIFNYFTEISNFSDQNQTFLIEYCELYNDGIFENLKPLVIDYLGLYIEWSKSAPEMAAWFETIAICDADTEEEVLENEPFAILLNPFHPIKLAWLLQAEKALFETLIRKMPCPAAGILNPSSFPDSILLSCFTTDQQWNDTPFISIKNNNSSWGVLWHSKKFAQIKSKKISDIFNVDFNLALEGLDSGLSSAQVENTLTDIFKIKAGQNTIKVDIESESSEAQSFNQGVANWIDSNLGSDKIVNNKKVIRDIWHSAGSRSLHVYDSRPEQLQPSSEELIDMTNESDYNLKWYSNNKSKESSNKDLAIISHLANQSPTLLNGSISSVHFKNSIHSERVRYSETNDKTSFTESRSLYDLNLSNSQDQLGILLTNAIYLCESVVNSKESGQLRSIPKLSIISKKLTEIDYCAVTSSSIDPSAFFDSSNGSYLWDYDLPDYSANCATRSGFYLLTKNNQNLTNSVKNSLQKIPGMGKMGAEKINNLLQEISGRGIPTLKTLASGGANANGEIGMLAALSFIQRVNKNSDIPELFPAKVGNTHNLIIPVDPFTKQYNSLCQYLDIDKIRPDLLALSIYVEDDEIISSKITPIEIKFRNKTMIKQDLASAHNQCKHFSVLYNNLLERSKESLIWDVARNKLLSDMASFAFSIYGKTIKDKEEIINWTTLQSKLISSFSDHNTLEVAETGRVIIISDYNVSDFDTINTTDDTLKIAFNDAKHLLKQEKGETFQGIKKRVNDWGLICNTPLRKENRPEDDKQPIYNLINEAPFIASEMPKEVLETIEVKKEPFINAKEKPVNIPIVDDEINLGIHFNVGNSIGLTGEKPYYFHPSNTALNQLNIGIVGDLGTGKTQLIKALIYNISKAPAQNRGCSPKFLIMDTKRDYDGSGDKASDKEFVQSIDAKIVKPFKLPINLFDIRSSKDDNPAYTKADFFIDILNKIYGGIGPKQENNLLEAVMKSFDDRGYEPYCDDYSNFNSPTLKDVFEAYKELCDDKVDTPYSLMNKLVQARLFEEDSSKTSSFSDFFNQTTVLSLGGIASNDKNLKMVMIIFMNLYREYMLGVKKLEYISKDEYQLRNIDSYLLIDEANLIMEFQLPVLEDLLLKGREFGVGIILSSQYLSHFRKPGTNYVEPLLTWFVHKIPNPTTKDLKSLGLNKVDESMVEKIKSLECHYCLYKTFDTDGEVIKGVPYYMLDKVPVESN